MFDGIARRYDLLNRLTSLGLDQRWRRHTVRALSLPPSARVLDLATGTADLALMLIDEHPDATVIGVDPSPRMLAIGREKARRRGLDERIDLREGIAEEIPLQDDAVDAVMIAFGIRNVPDRPRALREIARVTRPGGRAAILELTEPRGGWLGPLARFHVHRVVPALGAWLSQGGEYGYLRDSIEAFPAPGDFAAQMEGAGLRMIELRPMTLGACCLFVAEPRKAPLP